MTVLDVDLTSDLGRPTRNLLRCEGLDVYYGSVQILFDVDYTVDEGEIVALLGTNGAGKSTLLRAITGLTPPKRGKVWLDGKEITGISPVDMAKAGVGFMPGGRAIFPGLTVAENLKMAAWLYRQDAARVEAGLARCLELFPALKPRLAEKAVLLSGGQQQMVALAQALLSEPRLLLIDELSLGLAPVVVGELLEVVRELRNQGVTIILVEQSVNVALSVADRAVFMEKGEVRFTGPAADLLERGDLLRSVFIQGTKKGTPGQNGAAAHDTPAVEPVVRRDFSHEPVVLHATGITKRFGGLTAVDHVDLDVHAGEIVGILGANGAGKTTLLDLLTGFVPVDSGQVRLENADITDRAPELRAEAGLARSFQDARLFPGLTVAENLAVALEIFIPSRDPFAASFRLPAALLSEAMVAERVEQLIGLLGLGAFRDKYVGQLSTGSRRIVELGSLLAQQAKILMLDEPTAGIAQRESEAMGPLIRRIRDVTGVAIVIVEHDVPMLLSTCDRLVAMELGGVVADGDPAEVIQNDRVIASYLGADEAAISRSGSTTSGKAKKPTAARRTTTPARRSPSASAARAGRASAAKGKAAATGKAVATGEAKRRRTTPIKAVRDDDITL
ncbi:MAG: ATP-binding cassette domain-containing protein [Acidimicrobiales bacterium]